MRCLKIFCCLLLTVFPTDTEAQEINPSFRVLAFFKGTQDRAHISFVKEANHWFDSASRRHHFVYDSTDNWNLLNPAILSKYQVIIFLDARPESPAQRKSFEDFMHRGGAWMGFHFAGFALTPSAFPQNWNWYHNEFMGAG